MLTRRGILGVAAASAGAVLASKGLAQLLNGPVDASQLGVVPGNDVGTALNRAIATVSEQGGGTLRLAEGLYGTRETILLKPGVLLSGSGDTTLYAAEAISGNLVEQADGTSRCGLSDILLDCRGRVGFAAWRAVSPRETLCSGVTLRGWTFGLHFVCTAESAADGVTIRDTIVHQGAPRQIYPVFLSSTIGGLPFRNLLIERLRIVGTGGSYSPTNAATADQLALQNVRGFVLRDVVSREGGENGISIVRGSRDGVLNGIEVAGNDGHGLQLGAGGLQVTVSDGSALAKGMIVRGLESGAEATVDQVIGNQAWLGRLLQRQFREEEPIDCAGQRVMLSEPQFCRNFAVDGLTGSRNGRNAARARGAYADLYISQAENITLRNARLGGANGSGILVNNSRNVPCALTMAEANTGSTRKTGAVICS